VEFLYRVPVARGRTVKLFVDDELSARFAARVIQGVTHEAGVLPHFVRAAGVARGFLDIGCHVGWYACVAAVVRSRLRIALVDPEPRCLAMAERNLRLNDSVEGRSFLCAATDRVGHRIMAFAPDGDTLLGKLAAIDDPARPGVAVNTKTVDSIVEELNWHPDLIKIDVEGEELATLHGMSGVLRTRPTLFIEVHGHDGGALGRAAVDILRGHGYRILAIDKSGSLPPRVISDTEGIPPGESVLLAEPGSPRSY